MRTTQMIHTLTYYDGGARHDAKPSEKAMVTAVEKNPKPNKKGEYKKDKKKVNNYFNYEPVR